MAPSFHRFASLPPNVRRMIWMLSMPSIDPTLCVYNNRWKRQFGRHGARSRDVSMVQAPTPAALFVSREARNVALQWAAKNGLTLQLREETAGHIFVRPWDRDLDPVFVSRARWEYFIDEWESEEHFKGMLGSIKHLAIPGFIAFFHSTSLGRFSQYLPNLTHLYIVWDKPPRSRAKRIHRDDFWLSPFEPSSVMSPVSVQPRWEMIPRAETDVTMLWMEEDTDEESDGDWEQEGTIGKFMVDVRNGILCNNLRGHIWDRAKGDFAIEILAVAVEEVRPGDLS